MLIKNLRKSLLKFFATKIRKNYGSVEGFYQYYEIPLPRDNYRYSLYEDLAEGQREVIIDEEKRISALERKVIDKLNLSLIRKNVP